MAITTKRGISKTTLAAVGAGIGAAAAAAAGAYWFYGSKDAAKHHKSVRSWMLRARAEVLEAVEKVIDKVGQIDKDTYMNIVESVLKRYKKINGVTSEAMVQMTRDMKDAWDHMQKTGPGKRAKRTRKGSRKTSSK